MRITSSSFYSQIYGENNKINRQLFDVSKQISSGLQIQYAHENPAIFIDTLRLDDEITTFNQIKNSVDNANKMTIQTDTTIGEIAQTLETVKVKLLYAANEVHSETSMQAIANELRALKKHLMTLSNSSINGQYLFSGSAVGTKPIDNDGVYQGNDRDLEAFMGTGVTQKYNISGAELFLGEEKSVNRTISTNLMHKSHIDNSFIAPLSTIRDLMGDDADGVDEPSYFYLQGTRTDGSTFKSKIVMNMNDTMENLLNKIALVYDPNQTTPMDKQVSVTLNSTGQIEIIDNRSGSSKLDFHMVSAVDFSGGTAADVTDIDDLQAGTSDFASIGTNPLFVKEFTRSGLSTPAGTPNTIEGINYDRTNFVQDGAKLLSNTSQIVKSDNAFATPSNTLLEVAGTSSLIGKTLNLQGKNIAGVPYDLQINLAAASSVSGSINGVAIAPFTIFNADPLRTPTNGDQMTYQQLTDVINMVVSGSLPAGNSAAQYDAAIALSNTLSSTSLDYAGRLIVQDKTKSVTDASLALYDASSDTYPAATNTTESGLALAFNTNSALTLRDPKNDFFAQIELMILSVEQSKVSADGSDPADPRNVGINNAIQIIDDLSDHVLRNQTEIGSYSQLFDNTSKRTDTLIISAKKLQSETIDTDIAEATLRLQQLNINYQALYSSISKVSQLSLVNYL